MVQHTQPTIVVALALNQCLSRSRKQPLAACCLYCLPPFPAPLLALCALRYRDGDRSERDEPNEEVPKDSKPAVPARLVISPTDGRGYRPRGTQCRRLRGRPSAHGCGISKLFRIHLILIVNTCPRVMAGLPKCFRKSLGFGLPDGPLFHYHP